MSRLMALVLCFVLPTAAHAISLKDFEPSKMLEKVARESSVGTPHTISEDILDQGYTIEGNQLINHLSARASRAEYMRSNPDNVRSQLNGSMCGNAGCRQLLTHGAILICNFTKYEANQPIATEHFDADSCRIRGKKQTHHTVAILDRQHLLKIARTLIPFGKYQGRMLIDLPEECLLWFCKKGLLSGELGRLMQLTLKLEIDGLDGLLKPLHPPTPQANNVIDVIRRYPTHTQPLPDTCPRSAGRIAPQMLSAGTQPNPA